MIYTSSLNTCGCILSGAWTYSCPVYLYIHWPDPLLTGLHISWFSLPPTLWKWHSWRLVMIIRSGAKKTFSLINTPVSLGSAIIFFLVLHLSPMYFLVLEVSGPIQFHLSFSLIPGFSMFLYSSHLPALASTLCVLPFYVWVLLGCPCSSTEFSWPFCISFWSLGWTAFDLGKGHP